MISLEIAVVSFRETRWSISSVYKFLVSSPPHQGPSWVTAYQDLKQVKAHPIILEMDKLSDSIAQDYEVYFSWNKTPMIALIATKLYSKNGRTAKILRP